MQLTYDTSIVLENFEGPLDFLLYLIQKEEINLYEVSLLNVVNQSIAKLKDIKDRRLDLGAELIAPLSYFVFLKSKMLLPQLDKQEEIEEEFNLDLIHHLIQYGQFKHVSKALLKKQEGEAKHYSRGLAESQPFKKSLGIDHLQLNELELVFQRILEKSKKRTLPSISQETWKVSDKVKEIRLLFAEVKSWDFEELFERSKSRLELVVLFLALLELVKMGELCVKNQENSLVIFS